MPIKPVRKKTIETLAKELADQKKFGLYPRQREDLAEDIVNLVRFVRETKAQFRRQGEALDVLKPDLPAPLKPLNPE